MYFKFTKMDGLAGKPLEAGLFQIGPMWEPGAGLLTRAKVGATYVHHGSIDFLS